MMTPQRFYSIIILRPIINCAVFLAANMLEQCFFTNDFAFGTIRGVIVKVKIEIFIFLLSFSSFTNFITPALMFQRPSPVVFFSFIHTFYFIYML